MLNCRPRTGVTCLFEMTFKPQFSAGNQHQSFGKRCQGFLGNNKGKRSKTVCKPSSVHLCLKKSLGVTSMKHLLRCENFLTLLHPIVFEGQPLKTSFFSAKTRVIKAFQVYIHIFLIYYIPFYWLLIGISSFFFVNW